MKLPPDKKRRLDSTPQPFPALPGAGEGSIERKWDLVPKYITIKRKGEENFSKVSPFFVHKAIVGFVGEVKNIKKLRDGTILVEVVSEKQATRLLNCEKLCNGMEVEIKPHSFLNVSKGVIRCFDLDSVSIEEIKDELRPQKVTDVSRFTIRRNNELINTHSYLITFGVPEVPKNIKVGYLNIPVKLYIPSPRRCTKCLLFGHGKSFCKKNEMTCSWCSKTRHEGSCENPIMCAVCKGAHNSFDKNCPAFVIEREIKKIQITEKIPYGIAKRKFNENTPQKLILGKSKYSDVLLKTFSIPTKKVDSETQTDFKSIESQMTASKLSEPSPPLLPHIPPPTPSPPSPPFLPHTPPPTSSPPSTPRSSSPASRTPLPPSPTPEDRSLSGSFKLVNSKKQISTNKTHHEQNNKSKKLNKKNKKTETNTEHDNMDIETHNFSKNDEN